MEPIPFPPSSVPNDAEAARRYALRLEQRFKEDQQRILNAACHLDIAYTALAEMFQNADLTIVNGALALGQIDLARQALGL